MPKNLHHNCRKNIFFLNFGWARAPSAPVSYAYGYHQIYRPPDYGRKGGQVPKSLYKGVGCDSKSHHYSSLPCFRRPTDNILSNVYKKVQQS